MAEEEKQEYIRLLKKKYANTFYYPIEGHYSKIFPYDNVKMAEEITKKCKQLMKNNYDTRRID